MATLALNPSNGVVHAWHCTRGPQRQGSRPENYVEIPDVVLGSIATGMLCDCLRAEKVRRA